MLQKFKEGLKQIDIFGQSISLSFRKEEQYKTSMGGFLSICIIGTIISFFYSNIINFFAKLNVTSTQEFTFADDPDVLILDKGHFMFAVQIEQDNFTTNPYFNRGESNKVFLLNINIHIYFSQQFIQQKKGTIVLLLNSVTIIGFQMGLNTATQINIQLKQGHIYYIDLVPCTLQHFQPLFEKYSVDFGQQFEQQNLKNFLCPNPNFIHSLNMTVGGVWASTDYYFLKFSVTNCRDSSSSNFTWQPKCKTSDEILSTLNQQGSFRFQVFTTNFLINPNRPKDYVQPYLAIDQFYTFVPDKMFVQSDIFFRTKKVTTDQGILMYPQKQNETFAFRDYGDQREQFEISRITPNYYGAFYFQRSPYSYNINRKFLRLDELLSYLGGFTQFMIVVVGIVVRFYNRQHLIISMANDLYEFDMSSRRQNTQIHLNSLLARTERGREMLKSKMSKKIETIPKIQTLTAFQNKPEMLQTSTPLQQKKSQIFDKKMSIELQQPTQQVLQSRLSAMKAKTLQYFDDFKEFLKRKHVIGLNFRVILTSIIPIESLKDDDCMVLQRAIDQVNKELDIEYIIKKLHELTKLKQILFTSEQITLFNFTRKPKIALIQDSNKRRSTRCIIDGMTTAEDCGMMKQFLDLVNSYDKVTGQDQEHQTQEQIRFNQRLIVLLGPDLMRVLEKELSAQQQQQQVESVNNDPKDEDLFSEREIQVLH